MKGETMETKIKFKRITDFEVNPEHLSDKDMVLDV